MPSPNRSQDLRESQIVKAFELALAALFVACAVLVMGVSPVLKLAVLVLLTALPSRVPLPASLRNPGLGEGERFPRAMAMFLKHCYGLFNFNCWPHRLFTMTMTAA